MLKTNRGLVKYILLSIITLGIYGIVVMADVSEDINIIASRRDGKHTMNYLWIFLIFSWLTFGIVPLVWGHKITERIGDELRARHLPYEISAGTYWGWNILGSLIVIGPFVYIHKLFKAMNMLCADYNNEMLEARYRDSYDKPYKDPYDKSYRDSRDRSSKDTYDRSSMDSNDRYRR